jgi:hypothetical protein
MSSEGLVSKLKNAGWKDFAPGEFFSVNFETIGKAKVAKNNWFALLKSLPVLDTNELEIWNKNYKVFLKKSQAGMFSSGKFFVLILLVDTVGPDAVEQISREKKLEFLEMPDDIMRGGGYVLMFVKDQKKIYMPKKIKLSGWLHAVDFAKNTHRALDAYKNSLG